MASDERRDPHGRVAGPEQPESHGGSLSAGSAPTTVSAYRDISTQHGELDALIGQCRAVLMASIHDSQAIEMIEDLSETMEAHFAREESLYYPTLCALRPEVKASLQRLTGSHESFRRQLAALAMGVRAGSIANASIEFDQFAELFREHETAEETVLNSLIPAGASTSGTPG